MLIPKKDIFGGQNETSSSFSNYEEALGNDFFFPAVSLLLCHGVKYN